jgi:XTP/dITP diphosphohydrolase
MKLVLASNNAGKLAELQALFAPLGVELVRQSELQVGEADEPFLTFVENALAKARHASAATGLPAIADDAGLCVEAFGGLPGVATAYYATRCARCSSRWPASTTAAQRSSARWWRCAAPTIPNP